MANLFSITHLGRFGKYVCILVTSLLIYTTATAHATTYHNRGNYTCHFDWPAIVPEIVKVPVSTFSDFAYPKNDAKPINTNFQVIKHRSLGLINAQMNI